MEYKEYWRRIMVGAKKIGASSSAVAVWKCRGRVPHKYLFPIYLALKGTKNSITLENINRK